MSGTRQRLGSEVGPGSPAHHLTKPVGLAIDAEAEARVAEVVSWHLDPLLEIVRGLTPELGAVMARIAISKLIPLMDGGDAEKLLKAFARRIIETRKLET
jgi:hypothetical protein